MKRYLIVGGLMFVGFGVAFAPAGLLDRVISNNTEADLLEPRGTLWRGQAQLMANQVNLGQLNWNFQPLSLLSLSPGYNWSLSRADWQVTGSAAANLSTAKIDAQGQVQVAAINQWLRTYDINIQGRLDIRPSHAEIVQSTKQVSVLEGQIDWNGGRVSYTLAGVLREATLPPMSAYLSINDEGLPQAVVYAENQQTPLIIATLDTSGFAKVGITKLFTKLLNNPWPGSDSDHVIVLQVEEKII